MFTDIIAAIFTSYKLTLSEKDFTVFKMNKDDEEEQQKYWREYLQNEYSSEDFFIDSPEELMEKQQAFANPFCQDCNLETYSLITDEDNKIHSKCPKCRRTYKVYI